MKAHSECYMSACCHSTSHCVCECRNPSVQRNFASAVRRQVSQFTQRSGGKKCKEWKSSVFIRVDCAATCVSVSVLCFYVHVGYAVTCVSVSVALHLHSTCMHSCALKCFTALLSPLSVFHTPVHFIGVCSKATEAGCCSAAPEEPSSTWRSRRQSLRVSLPMAVCLFPTSSPTWLPNTKRSVCGCLYMCQAVLFWAYF